MTDNVGSSPYRHLALAVIADAIKDRQHPNSAKAFLLFPHREDDLDFWCHVAEISVDSVRSRFMEILVERKRTKRRGRIKS